MVLRFPMGHRRRYGGSMVQHFPSSINELGEAVKDKESLCLQIKIRRFPRQLEIPGSDRGSPADP
jgi:hypothetical protein